MYRDMGEYSYLNNDILHVYAKTVWEKSGKYGAMWKFKFFALQTLLINSYNVVQVVEFGEMQHGWVPRGEYIYCTLYWEAGKIGLYLILYRFTIVKWTFINLEPIKNTLNLKICKSKYLLRTYSTSETFSLEPTR